MPNIKRPHNSRNSPARVKAAERQRTAMQLRKAGATFAQIAAELGYHDAKGAERAVIAGLRTAGREASEDLLPLELARLDQMQMGLWQDAISGDVPAVLAMLKIMERRAKYTGIDAPLKMNTRVDSHQQMDVDIDMGVMVIRAGDAPGTYAMVQGDKNDYLAGLQAVRADIPLAIDGTSTVQNGQQPDMSEGHTQDVSIPSPDDDDSP